ncbi:helix-turn-helix domain-containing protein, partial [Akkermansia muciniphila]|uniref:helix-turn-helix domain-containing protein n=1 Tax=Akkermansia muciniphila TaxID=239935 RepID=UPI00122EDC5F
MPRDKEALAQFHRSAMLEAAQALFTQKGVAATTMDDIAKAAGYSKATLYVYFQNKEEMVGALALKGM